MANLGCKVDPFLAWWFFFCSLPYFSIDQMSVSLNLILKADLDIQQLPVVCILAFHVLPDLLYLGLHVANQPLHLGDLGTVAAFCLRQGGFQRLPLRGKRVP